MATNIEFHFIDWFIIVLYLTVIVSIGIIVRKKASRGKEDYFLAGRSTPWWIAGVSIAATTFGADTPLIVTGLVASKGISGNWFWLSLVGIHVALFIFFAIMWNRSGVITDAEIISLRYSGKLAAFLRTFRAFFYGIVVNCIVLSMSMLAMTKIITPFFHWHSWLPGLMTILEAIWPKNLSLGSPSEVITLLFLLSIIGIYSSLGGVRASLIIDLIQFVIKLAATAWFAYLAWEAVGGRSGLVNGLNTLYGHDHYYLDLFPQPGTGWVDAIGMGMGIFFLYLFAQSMSNKYSDGGGYLMQRLNTTKNPNEARKAAMTFIVFQYLVRTWPWFMIATAALVLIPIGQEMTALNGSASLVHNDREMAYPVLMGYLLTPGILGFMVTGMMAAFMSTVDTHINWGASYIVNDIFLKHFPNASNKVQIIVARTSVISLIFLAIFMSLQMHTVEFAWKTFYLMAASLGIPTVMRWFWWRVNASAELCALGCGLTAVFILLTFTDLPYEIRLIYVSLASILGMLLGIIFGPKTDLEQIDAFYKKVKPIGFWPGSTLAKTLKDLSFQFTRWAAVVTGLVSIMFSLHNFIFVATNMYFVYTTFIIGVFLVWFAGFYLYRDNDTCEEEVLVPSLNTPKPIYESDS